MGPRELLRAVRRRIARSSSDRLVRMGLEVAPGCSVRGRPRVKMCRGARICLESGVVLNSNPEDYHAGMPFPVTLVADRPGARITVGEGSRLHGCCLHAWDSIRLGRLCLVAGGAQFLDAHGHASKLEHALVRHRAQDEPEPIDVGDHCWIGLGALVLKGAHIGECSIVAAHAVVRAGTYPPHSLLAGAPARVVRTCDAADLLPADASDADLLAEGLRPYSY